MQRSAQFILRSSSRWASLAPQAAKRAPAGQSVGLHSSAASYARSDSSHSKHGHRNQKSELLDFYKILGVPQHASHSDIKAAFRELGTQLNCSREKSHKQYASISPAAKEHHPDMGNKSSVCLVLCLASQGETVTMFAGSGLFQGDCGGVQHVIERA